METSTNTQEELRKLSQDTRDSIRGKNNYKPSLEMARVYPSPVHNDLPAEIINPEHYE